MANLLASGTRSYVGIEKTRNLKENCDGLGSKGLQCFFSGSDGSSTFSTHFCSKPCAEFAICAREFSASFSAAFMRSSTSR